MKPITEAVAMPVVRRQAHNPRVWQVQLPGEPEPHTVDLICLPDDRLSMVCTCQEKDNPNCDHIQAVEAMWERKRDTATARRAQGIYYTGARVVMRSGPTEEGFKAGSFLTATQVFVWVGNQVQPLDPQPSQDLRNHSPDGFAWGYEGSGPAQLALAILLDYTGDEDVSLRHYQEFKRALIAALPRETRDWTLGAEQIEQFLTVHHKTDMTLPSHTTLLSHTTLPPDVNLSDETANNSNPKCGGDASCAPQ